MINTVFTLVVEDKDKGKHSQITHTPSVLSLGSNEIPLKTGGPTTSPGSRGTHHIRVLFLFCFLLYGTKCHLFKKSQKIGFTCFCKNRRRTAWMCSPADTQNGKRIEKKHAVQPQRWPRPMNSHKRKGQFFRVLRRRSTGAGRMDWKHMEHPRLFWPRALSPP